MNASIRAVSLVLVCAVLVSCGGGGGGGGNSTTSVASISGSVIDGYIEGATVCIDLNANQTCDSSEPNSTTNSSGAYTLSTSSLTLAQIRAAHVLVVVPSAAKDMDDGGQTLTQAGKKPFWLLAPTSAYVTSGGAVSGSAVVSPFTTLVSHAMLANPGTALDDAQSVIRTQLNLPSTTDLHQNFVSTPNASLQSKARTIAYLIGKVSDGATSVGGATERERLMAALQYVRNNAAKVQSIVDADSVNLSVPSKVNAAIGTVGLSPDYANLVAQTKELTSVETGSYANILGAGVYVNTCFLSPSCNFSLYGKLSLQASQATLNYFSESSGAWVAYTVNNSNRRLGANGWDAPQFSSTFSYTAIDSLTAESVGPLGGVSTRGTLGVMDLSNKTSADIPGAWSKSVTYLKSVTFPSGSQAYISRGVPTADQYTLWNDYPYTSGPAGSRAPNSSYTSLANLIADHQTTGATNTSKHLSWSDIIVTFDSNAASGTATLWNDTNYPCVRTVNGYSCGGGSPSFTKIGTVPYETRSVAGTSILVIFAQSSVDEAGYPIYSARSGSVYRGIFTPKGHAYNSSLYFNRTAFDAILNSWSKPAVLN